MTGQWGTRAHRVYTGGNPITALNELGVSMKHPEFEPPDAKEVLKMLGPVPRQKRRRPRSSNKIKKAWKGEK